MYKTIISYKNIWYPPGGILMWIIIFLELFTFGAALIAMVFYGNQELEIFHDSRLKLNTTYGMINTLFLLTSGFLWHFPFQN
jgi:nitric oxide reductase NorE protein